MGVTRPQGGSTANASGATGETFIQNQLVAKGLVLATKEEHHSARALLIGGYSVGEATLPNKFYRQLPAFKSIYKVPFKADFIIKSIDGRIGLIEMKWQVSAGSVDEKLPFWLSTLQNVPEHVSATLVVIGGGVRSGALDWIKNNAGRVNIALSFRDVQKIIGAM